MTGAAARRLRILERFYGGASPEPTAGLSTGRLCQGCADLVGVSGAGIMLMSSDGPWGSLCTTNEVSALIEEWQYTLGEGPCVDAFYQDQPVLEPDLAHPDTPRWLAFTNLALEAGVRAVFGFPLRVGAVRIGALNLYCDHSGPLGDDQHADALVLADVVARAMLVMEAGAPSERVAADLSAGVDFKHVVHQASGMVSVQLNVSIGEALIRIRAFAFANDQALVDVAERVVARQLRFGEPNGELTPADGAGLR